jgi:NADH:quinone reductase (non-electrogenic)
MSAKTRVVILGGGFGGLYAAARLEKTIGRRQEVEITVINCENFFLFTPMLHEVAAGDVDVTHIVNPIRKMLKRGHFFDGEVERIDLAARKVIAFHGVAERHVHEIEYDHLVLALGSITNFYNLPGLSERALTMKTLGDAIHLRNHLIELLEEADFECCADKRESLLTMVVAGAGFAGVETIAAVNDFLREALKSYRNLNEKMLRLVLIHPAALILPELGDKLGAYAQRKLAQRGVEIRVNTKVLSVAGSRIELSDGSSIMADTLVWTAGSSPNPLIASIACEKTGGRVCVNENLEVAGSPGVWALGDCAMVPDRKCGGFCPPTAQHALRQGKVVADNIAASITGGTSRPFNFKTVGQLAAIGRRTGVARIFGVKFSGFIAWWLWRTIYLSKLPRLEKKIRVALDWTLDLFFPKEEVQFLTLRAPSMSTEEHADYFLNVGQGRDNCLPTPPVSTPGASSQN